MDEGESEQRYRIILGDNCEICRVASRISFPAGRPPKLPIAGCRDPGGCRCRLPVPAPSDIAVVLDTREGATAAPVPVPVAPAPPPEPVPVAVVAAEPPPAAPEWREPAPITQQRRQLLHDLTESYHLGRIQGIRIDTAPSCCPVCAEVAESIYMPSVTPPLPVVGCAHGWRCRCLYAAEPLPLTEDEVAAMSRLEAIERERMLRLRGVAIGGPRWLHVLVGGVSLATIPLAARLAAGGGVAATAAGAAIVAALLCLLVAALAVRRYRPLPAPPSTYVLLGLIVAILALWPFWGIHLPPGLTPVHLERLGGVTATPHLPPLRTGSLLDPPVLLAGAGLVLLLLGMLGAGTAAGYERRALQRSGRGA